MRAYTEANDPAQILRQPGAQRRGTWARRGAQFAEGGRPELSPDQLAAALAGLWRRGARQREQGWTELDRATIHEVKRRAVGFDQMQDAIGWAVPAWLTVEVAPRQLHLFLAMVLHAYRLGAVGALLSYEEWAAMLGASRRSVSRWQALALDLDLIRVLPTVREERTATGGRQRARNLIQPGAALLAAAHGAGALEGRPAPDPAAEGQRRRAAQLARRKARAYRRGQLGQRWTTQEATRERAPVRSSETGPSAATAAQPATAGEPSLAPAQPERTAQPATLQSIEAPSRERGKPPAETASQVQPRESLTPSATSAPQPPPPSLRDGGEASGPAAPSVPAAPEQAKVRRPSPAKTSPSDARPHDAGAGPRTQPTTPDPQGASPGGEAQRMPARPPDTSDEADAGDVVDQLAADFAAKLRRDADEQRRREAARFEARGAPREHEFRRGDTPTGSILKRESPATADARTRAAPPKGRRIVTGDA